MKESAPAVQILRDHHKKVIGLFQQLKAVSERASDMEEGVWKELLMELEIDFEVKKRFFYPALKSHLKSQEHEILVESVLKGINECQKVECQKIGSSGNLEQLEELLVQYQDIYETEEEEIYPIARNLPSQVQSQLASEMEQEKNRIYAFPEYRDALPSKAQNPKGGEQSRKIA